MRKLIVIVAMVCAVFAAQAQTKVGHVNRAELIDLLPEKDSLMKVLQSEQADWQKMLDEKEKEAGEKYQALMAIADDASVSEGVKEIKMKEVENLQVQYQELQQLGQQTLQKRQEELITPLITKISEAIEAVAKEKGYDYVLDLSQGTNILYSNASHNLMVAVKTKLGVN